MEENKKFGNYSSEEIDAFLNNVIDQVEKMIEESKHKNDLIIVQDRRIKDLEKELEDYNLLKEKVSQYEKMEETINTAVNMAQKTSDQIRNNANKERDFMLEDARRNANRIVNEALLKAEKAEMEAENLKRNVNIFKRKMKGIIEAQLEMVDDIEKVEF